jgi:PEGA domain
MLASSVMTISRGQIVDRFPPTLDAQQPLASWYAQGISDGIGKRLLMFDNTDAPSWELLRFRPDFAATPGFQDALRERIAQLRGFRHPSFPSVRVVDDLVSQGGLTLVSTYVAGRLLSEALERPRNATIAMRLIQQLTPAVAALQQQGEGIAHGVLTTDRIVLTNDGRFFIREHVLGSALQCLGLSSTRLWVDLGVVAGPIGTAVPRLDWRTDVIQLALVALSLMLGRRVHASEYPNKIEDLLDHVARTAGRGSPLVFTALRHWLERALQLSDGPFESAQAANEALGKSEGEAQGEEADFELPAAHAPDALALKPARVSEPQPATAAPVRQNSPAPYVSVDVGESSRREKSNSTDRSVPIPISPYAEGLRVFPEEAGPISERQGTAARRPVTKPAEYDQFLVATEARDDVSLGAPPRVADRTKRLRWVAAAAVLVAIGEAVVIGRLHYARLLLPPPAAAAIVVESPQPGSSVLVDGRPAGFTPLRLNVAAGTLSIRVQNPEASTRTKMEASQLATASENPRRPITQQNPRAVSGPRTAAVPQRSGGMRLSSTIELDVFEGERRLGSSREGPIRTTPGRHEFDLVNTALGYQSRRVVEIKEGQMVSLEVMPANGTVSINANPWAVAWIDGNSVGETPLANLSVPLGEHEFVFRHPQLGERRQKAIVRAEGVTRVTANLQR